MKRYACELSGLMNDSDKLKNLANKAMQDVKRFSVQNVVDQWERLFNSL